jgi:hypothetical protein
MKTFRPQDYAMAVLYIMAAIGPALAGLAIHLIGVAVKATWGVVTHG